MLVFAFFFRYQIYFAGVFVGLEFLGSDLYGASANPTPLREGLLCVKNGRRR